MRRVFLLLVMAALMLPVAFLTGSPGGQALARQDAPGCEGLADYRDAMYGVGRYLNDTSAAAGLFGERNLFTYSSEDWTAYADIALEAQRRFKALTPPAFAADYHQVLIERFGLFEQAGRAAASNGPTALLEFSDPMDDLGERELTTTAAATAICADFEEVADSWVRQSSAATGSPVAGAQEAAAEIATAPKPSPTPAVQTSSSRFETAGTGTAFADVHLIPGTYVFRFDCDVPGGTAGIYLPAVGPKTIGITPTGTTIAIPGIGNDLVLGLLTVHCDGSWTVVATPGN